MNTTSRFILLIVLSAIGLAAFADEYTPPGTPVFAPQAGNPVYPVVTPSAQAAYAPPVYPMNAPSVAMPPAQVVEKLSRSSWYTRVDWFQWNERDDGASLLTESGALYTVGYTHRSGIERFRIEVFGGDMHYDGGAQFDDNTVVPLTSSTRYLGGRGEYELVLEPSMFDSSLAFLLGAGSRFWVRDIRSGLDDAGDFVEGYQETWWTIYPYLGIEAKRSSGTGWELYSQGRVGATVATVSYATAMQEPVWPKCGVTALGEIGLRSERFFLSANCELMTWTRSSEANGWDSTANLPMTYWQPTSRMLTLGGRMGFMF